MDYEPVIKSFIMKLNMKKINLTIAIPAYNEEENIKSLLQNLLRQKTINYNLKEIIVVSDASTDNTEKEIISLKNPKIKLIKHTTRKGQAFSQNEILKSFNSEVLVLLNADILPVKDNFVDTIINPFLTQTNIGITGGSIVPLPANNYFEKIINFSVDMKKSLYGKINNGNNVYNCHGRVRAFSKKFADEFKWMPVITEDAFSYLLCIQKGYKFVYVPEAEVYYTSPDNLKDHISQSARFLQSQKDLRKYIKPAIIKKAYKLPNSVKFSTTLEWLFRNPIMFVSYLTILTISKIISWKFFKNSLTWTPSLSSKKLRYKFAKK